MQSRRSSSPLRNRRLKPVAAPAPKAAPAPSAFSGVDWGRARMWAVGAVMILLLGALWCRAYYIQIVRGPDLAALANRQYAAKETLTGMRGRLLDRNGNILAMSVEGKSVWANPAEVVDVRRTAAVLAPLLGMPAGRIATILERDRRFIWLARKVSDKSAAAIKNAALPGIHLTRENERIYPNGHLAGQLLGFVNVDDQGLEGLERSLNGRLAGKSLSTPVQRDAAGRRLSLNGLGEYKPLHGEDVHLTIDSQIQYFAEEALAENVEKFGAKWGGCLVVDVPTGEILAWAQYPFFDPNRYKDFPERIRRNRVVGDALEQGSTIKSFLMAAALEEKVVTPETVINCAKGSWKLGRFTIHDTHSYADLTATKILHVSSNIGAAKIGLKLGAEKYRGYLSRLGFGDRSGLSLEGESSGILRQARRWQEIDLATASFGQSFSATLIQMAGAYLCLAGDGVRRSLSLVRGADPVRPDERVFSPETMRQVRAMLREVVEEEGGTGSQARIPGIVVGGKTGTAQKADGKGAYGSGRVGSFVGMVPSEEPRYLICVLLDEPTKSQYGGVIAAPVFRSVALQTMAYHGLLPDSDDPLVMAAAAKEAGRKNRAGEKPAPAKATAGVKPANGKPVDPKAATAKPTDPKTASATATADDPGPVPVAVPGAVPPVVGMGMQQAVQELAKHGAVPAIEGKGRFVVQQSPEPGRPWPADKKECIIRLGERAL